jgi:uncharacterized protein (DUF1501 family)
MANGPAFAPEQLFEGRDLALTTDFRDVFSEVLTKHMRGRRSDESISAGGAGQPLGIL